MPGPYLLPHLPGYWKPTPSAEASGDLHALRRCCAVPHCASGRQFLVAPPPALTSDLYAADFNEVKAIGSVSSTTRTAEETSIALRWAASAPDEPLRLFGTTSSAMSREDLVGPEFGHRARVCVAEHVDARRVAVTFTANSYTVSGGRSRRLGRPPKMATRRPRRTRPGRPSRDAALSKVSGQHDLHSGRGVATLQRVLGRDDIPFSVTWTGTGTNADITRSYNGLRELADEERRAGFMAASTSSSTSWRALGSASRWPTTSSTTICVQDSQRGKTEGPAPQPAVNHAAARQTTHGRVVGRESLNARGTVLRARQFARVSGTVHVKNQPRSSNSHILICGARVFAGRGRWSARHSTADPTVPS